MLILIAGPYRSGTNDDAGKMADNLKRLEEVSWPLFQAGHLPMIGEWVALPVWHAAGGKTIGDALYDQIFHPAAGRLIALCDAILRLQSGAGGTEAMDWCGMLYRMYTRWAERKGYKVEVLDYQEGDEAGIKSVMFQVNGENAYGYLKSEKGTHRLVRISPFNAQAKRQTSFCQCDVMPVIDQEIDIEIRDEDIRIDTYRSSGAGGQHINKTSSAIRITHIPTGIVVTCQNERSQFQNKDKAMQVLRMQLYELEREKQAEKEAGIRGEKTDIAWGHQIRSYVLQPYTLVKDLRTDEERGQADRVLDGDLDPFINAYLKWRALQKKEGHQQI